jgi:GNAT superfamily N-acetyltransferase
MLTIDLLHSPTAAQIGAVARLYRETGWWPDAEVHPESVRALVEGSTLFCVANDAGQIVGMGRVISDGVSDAYLQDIAVTTERRGEGIATRIVAALVDLTRKRGIDWIGLIAKGGATGVYARCGFQNMTDATPMRYQES